MDPLAHRVAWRFQAALFNVLSRHVEARDTAKRSLRIHEKTAGPESAKVAFALRVLAQMEAELGEYDQARARYEQCLAVTRSSEALWPGQGRRGVSRFTRDAITRYVRYSDGNTRRRAK